MGGRRWGEGGGCQRRGRGDRATFPKQMRRGPAAEWPQSLCPVNPSQARPALGVPRCVGRGGEGLGVLPGLTFQHLDSHFHRGLRMAQAMSSGLHHLPKGPRAKGTSWGRDGPSAPGPPGICLPPSLGSAYISLHPHPGLKVFPPMRLLKSRPSLVSHLSAVCFLNHLSPWKPCSLPRGEHSSSAPLGFPARLSIGLALSLSSVKTSFLVTKGSHLTE